MGEALRLTLEIGPKGKKIVAVAPDWPGLQRGAKTAEAAIERLVSYLPRYAGVAKLAGLGDVLADSDGVEVVETYPGVGSTDFWGISFAFSAIDQQALTGDGLERELSLMRACWAYFDGVRRSVSPELRKGPRGGGRDRDRVVRHTIGSELDMSKKVGVLAPLEQLLSDEHLAAYRAAYCDAIRTFHAEGKPARTWPLRYLIRHTAFHTMDHSWEMEDKDLTAATD